jgi:hypothetical protein
MSRIPLVTEAAMTPEQRAVHDAMVNGPRKSAPVGPLAIAMHRPELAQAMSGSGVGAEVRVEFRAAAAGVHHPVHRPVLGLPVRVGLA